MAFPFDFDERNKASTYQDMSISEDSSYYNPQQTPPNNGQSYYSQQPAPQYHPQGYYSQQPASFYQAPPIPQYQVSPPPQYAFQPQPVPVYQGMRMGPALHCPYCHTYAPVVVQRRISTAGWVTFAILIFLFIILCWIGLLIQEDYYVCSHCGSKLS